MRTKVLAVAAVLLVVMLGVAFQWRYDEVQLPHSGRKQLVRTNRYTGEVQRLSSHGGWVSSSAPSEHQPSVATPAPGSTPDPYAKAFEGLPPKP